MAEAGDEAASIAVDAEGAAVVCGYTRYAEYFPVQNPLSANDSGHCAFVTKFSADGSALEFSSTIGGNISTEYAHGVALDPDGNVYVAGSTWVPDFPVVNPLMTWAGEEDAFACEISADGSQLLYSTYLGGDKSEVAFDVAVDSEGRMALLLRGSSANYPVVNPIRLHPEDPAIEDAMLSVLSADGSELVLSTFLSGTGGLDPKRVEFDASGDVYACGQTGSDFHPSAFPLVYSIQPRQGDHDVFVIRVTPATGAIVYSTLLGGSDWEEIGAIDFDSAGGLFVAGTSSSLDFSGNPTPVNHGFRDIYLAQISNIGATCCEGLRDDVDGIPGEPTLNDLSAMIDYLFINLTPPPCWEEADLDGTGFEGPGSVTLSDLSVLVDHLFISMSPLLPCP